MIIRSLFDIDEITIHCSDSDNPEHDDISVIRKWHKEERKWQDVGYHFFITTNGVVQTGRSLEFVGAHCKGHNKRSIGICFSGKFENGSLPTDEQIKAGKALIAELSMKFCIKDNNIKPHNFYDKNKTCPNFNIEEVLL